MTTHTATRPVYTFDRDDFRAIKDCVLARCTHLTEALGQDPAPNRLDCIKAIQAYDAIKVAEVDAAFGSVRFAALRDYAAGEEAVHA